MDRIFRGHNAPVSAVAFQTDGKALYSGAADGNILVRLAALGTDHIVAAAPAYTLTCELTALQVWSFQPDHRPFSYEGHQVSHQQGQSTVLQALPVVVRPLHAMSLEWPRLCKRISLLVSFTLGMLHVSYADRVLSQICVTVTQLGLSRAPLPTKAYVYGEASCEPPCSWLKCFLSPRCCGLQGRGFDQQSWACRQRVPLVIRAHTACIRSIHFSSSGKLLLSASDDKTVKVTCCSLCPPPLNSKCNGSKLRHCTEQGLAAPAEQVWQPATQQFLFSLCGHTNWVRTCMFSPSEQLAASAGDDKSIHLWCDPSSGTLQHYHCRAHPSQQSFPSSALY